jgi:hypothetical protein
VRGEGFGVKLPTRVVGAVRVVADMDGIFLLYLNLSLSLGSFL